jgi:hypothetical protein
MRVRVFCACSERARLRHNAASSSDVSMEVILNVKDDIHDLQKQSHTILCTRPMKMQKNEKCKNMHFWQKLTSN